MYRQKVKSLPRLKVALLAVIVFFAALVFKSRVIDLFRIPLVINSILIEDTKSIFTYRFIQNENLKLKEKLGKLSQASLQTDNLRLENERLKQLLSLKKDLTVSSICAYVIAMDPINWSRSAIINKGSKDGIRAGDGVVSYNGVIGRIAQVYKNTSRVILINDPDSSVACLISRTREQGVLSGTLSGDSIIQYLEKESTVQPADIIVTSNLSLSFPEGLLIGYVRSVELKQRGLTKYCLVDLAANLNRIEEVLVLKKE